MPDPKIRIEEITISGDRLVSTVKDLVRQGNIRRIAVRNHERETLLEIPLTLGVVGIVLLPTLAALGAIAALVADCTIVIERMEPESPTIDKD